jgi:DnaJ homolog subfamily C member 9
MNPYKILGLMRSDSLTETDIARAYRRLALQFHPDRNPDGAEQFKTIAFAYSVLSDPLKRQMFDDHGIIAEETGGAGAAGGASNDVERSVEVASQVAAFYQTYAGSDEEREELLSFYKKTKGDLKRIIVEFALFDNGNVGEPERIRSLIQRCIEEGLVNETARWERTSSDAALKKIVRLLDEERSAATEALAEIHGSIEDIPQGGGGGMGSLQALILQRQGNAYDTMMGSLEAKYGAGQKKKVRRGKHPRDEDC